MVEVVRIKEISDQGFKGACSRDFAVALLMREEPSFHLNNPDISKLVQTMHYGSPVSRSYRS
jgi:hypothetical protein